MTLRLVALALVCLSIWACKVPITDIEAGFVVADTAWFSQEETLFIFYELHAQQGLGDESVLEIQYTTDDGSVPWTDLTTLTQVHPHVPVDCGFDARCGSGSLHITKEPRGVALRLRYHRDGELALDARTVFNAVGPGPAHSHRSLLIYGVFEAGNRGAQWRSRHQFPTVRNEDAQRLGLRRPFTIDAQSYGETPVDPRDNPYLYGAGCTPGHTPLGWATVGTDTRAVFNPTDLPDAAAPAGALCARSTVHDATGDFATNAVARKNPEVRPAFPVLRSPTKDATPIKYVLAMCERTISSDHLAMQRQRLFLNGVDPICIDDWDNGRLSDTLVARFREDVERVRAEGNDMVLALALHHDVPDIGPVVEAALAEILSEERDRATPRVAGAFLLDSYTYVVRDSTLDNLIIWCPVQEEPREGFENRGTESDTACAVLFDVPGLSLGPLSVAALPILPTRSLYLDFISQYSDAQAGKMTSLSYLVPERPPGSDHVSLDGGGIATFFNDEVITADADDAFSFCQNDEYAGFVFRPTGTPLVGNISGLATWHTGTRNTSYDLGIIWDFPFVLRLEYESVIATAITAFSVSLPVGFTSDAAEDYGSEIWLNDTFPLEKTLIQCLRFCDHPTFDSAGIYQVRADFRGTYGSACYVPNFPERGDSGFPDDP